MVFWHHICLLSFYHIKDCFKDKNILTYITYINIHFNIHVDSIYFSYSWTRLQRGVMNLQLFKLFNFNIHVDSIYFIVNKITNRCMLKIIVMNLQLFLFKLFKFTNLCWPHKCIDVLINHLLFDLLHTYMEILFLIKLMNHKNYEFNPLVSSVELLRSCLQYVKINYHVVQWSQGWDITLDQLAIPPWDVIVLDQIMHWKPWFH